MQPMSARSEVISLVSDKLKLLFLKPGERSIYTYFLFLICTIFRCIQIFYAFSLIGTNTDSFVVMANGAKTIAANCQGIKQIALFHDEKLIFLIKNIELFWQDEETERFEKQCRSFTKLFFNLVYVAYFAIILVPVMRGALPFVGKYPTFAYSFWLFSAMECFQFGFDSIVTVAVDCLFLCLCIFTYGQFKLLNNKISTLEEKELSCDVLSEAVGCVKHHAFLLEFCQTFASMYSPALLIEYSISCVSICIEVFVFTKQNAMGMIASVFYLATLVFQLSMFCFPAQMVINEAANTSDAIFESAWNDHLHLAKTFLVRVMQRAQKNLKFSGGGLINIDRAAFTAIFKWTLSLYTLMNDIERLFG